MKYIKKFENLGTKFNIGDYVVSTPENKKLGDKIKNGRKINKI